MTRTPDAPFLAEARHRGARVVGVSPDYAEYVKFADEWLAVRPGTDGAERREGGGGSVAAAGIRLPHAPQASARRAISTAASGAVPPPLTGRVSMCSTAWAPT